MDERIYQFCGYDYGTFTTREGDERKYCSIFCLSKMEPRQGSCCGGYRAEKFRCASPDVFEGIEPQDSVMLAFNRYGSVIAIQPVDKGK